MKLTHTLFAADAADVPHTPGPWEASEDNCGGGLNIRSAHKRVGHSSEVNQGPQEARISGPEAKANAKAMAAAPEALDFIEQLANDIADKCAPTCDCWACERYDAAVAILVKAGRRHG